MSSSSERSEECNRLVFEAVYESSVSKLRDVTYTYSEDELLTSFVQCNENGENSLVVAIKGGNVEFIHELIWFLKNQISHRRHPVPFNAFDKLSHQMPILQLIEHLFDGYSYSDIAWLDFIAQVFIKSTSFPRQDKIISLELIGAFLNMVLPLHGHPANPSELGLQCWREAMTFRYFPAEGEPLLPKIPYVGVPSVASNVVFGSSVEVLSMEGLDLLQENFKRNFYSFDHDVRLTCKILMQRQALLVIRRVTSESNSEHPHRLYLESLNEFRYESELVCFSNLGSSADYKLVINTYLFILEQATCYDPKGLFHESLNFFISTLQKIAHYFIKILRQPLDSPGSGELSYANLLPPTKFFGTIATFLPELAPLLSRNPYDFIAVTMIYFVFVSESISSRLSRQEKQHLDYCYSNYIRNFFPERTTTVLHAAVKETMPWIFWDTFRVTVDNFKSTIKLLKLGADPNAIDGFGRTPLHIFAGREKIHLDDNVALFRALVDAGTHLDIAAINGSTVLSILKKNLVQSNQSSLIVPPYYESLLNTVFPLSCYCARVIRRHGIPFDRLPLHLQKFVSRHGRSKR